MAAEQSPPVATPLKVEESKKEGKVVKVIGKPDLDSQSSSVRRSWKPSRSLMQYLVGDSITFFSCFEFLFLFLFLLLALLLLSSFSFLETGDIGSVNLNLHFHTFRK